MALGDAGYEEIYLRPCSKDCKLIENLFASHATYGNYKKWTCDVSTTPVDWHKPYNMTKVVHEMTCTYACGNRVFDEGETCDIGGWAFTGMTGGDVDGAAGFQPRYLDEEAPDAATWYTDSSSPKVNNGLILGCSKDC